MDTIKIDRQNVKMVAHRGLSGIECENSCAAFIAAGNRDYFGIETDVHKTADGKYVVIHDDVTGRVCPVDISVEGSTYDELRALSLLDKDGAERTDLRIPSLAEYLKICARYEKVCVLELKNAFRKEDIAEILEIVKAHTTLEKMVFISFDYQNMVYLRELSPEANLQFLCSCPVDEELVAKLKAHSLDLDIRHTSLDEAAIALLHKNGIIVNCWTVDDPERAADLVRWGVDYITSNILQ